MIEVTNLSVQIRETPILRGVNLRLEPGRITGLTGESGSGKSMTALALIGLLPRGAQTAGRVDLDGTDLLSRSEAQMRRLRGRKIAMIFQEPMTALNPLMTIGDQVAEAMILHGTPRNQARARARDKLDRVGLTAPRFPMTLYPHELSGGQRQRVAIALAIAENPALLIADEPTTALDVITQAQILDLLRGLVRDGSMSLLLVTHDLAVIAAMADSVAVMQAGQIVESGPTETVFRAPSHPYTRQLFAAARHQPAQARTARTDAPPILVVDHARREYSRRTTGLARNPAPLVAVDDASLTIAPGEALGLIGPSGCGKSTLMRAILGLDPLQGGQILLDGQPVLAGGAMAPALRAKAQVVFQDPFASFDPRWRVERLVAEPFHLTGRPANWRARVTDALAEVGITPDALGRYIHEFSGGQRQRIAIARALLTRPDLIVLDEAVSALDMRVRAQVLDLLARLRREHGLAYLFISHDLSVVRQITDRVAIMEAGRIVETGPTPEVMARPRHPATRRLIDAIPRIPAAWTQGLTY